MSETNKPRTVKLFCPSVSKVVPFVAWDEQKLDLGYIARVFGLDPSTLKLNGHFISRGVDLVSSSVTWRSLLKFFSAKGLSTGKYDKDALVVDGKLCKVGTKRGHDPQDAMSRISCRSVPETETIDVGRRPLLEYINSLTNKKLKESKSGCEEGHRWSKWNGLGCKRKQLFEDISLLKKLKINNTNSGKANNKPSSVSGGQFKCRYIRGNMKRMREDEMLVAAPCKRIR